MTKTILITGSTDGIGLETAKILALKGHNILLHGRSSEKLTHAEQALDGVSEVKTYTADLSLMSDVESFAQDVTRQHAKLDILINNAGVFNVPNPIMEGGMDIRFVVNTIAPYLLTQRLLPLLDSSGRVINLSSAAQAPVDLNALSGGVSLSAGEAYAQSKLALTMWSRHLAISLGSNSPVIVAVNPASFLGSKMVKEAYGSEGKDLRIGADILTRAALSDEFADASGKYFDNDSGSFASPHPDALDDIKSSAVVSAIEEILKI